MRAEGMLEILINVRQKVVVPFKIKKMNNRFLLLDNRRIGRYFEFSIKLFKEWMASSKIISSKDHCNPHQFLACLGINSGKSGRYELV